MNKPNPAPEPTMEEILASIRRIISDGDDGAATAAAEAAKSAAPKAEPEPEEDTAEADADIFDLTDEMVAEEADETADDDDDAAVAESEDMSADEIDKLMASEEMSADDIDKLMADEEASEEEDVEEVASALVEPENIEVAFDEPETEPEPEFEPEPAPEPVVAKAKPARDPKPGLLSPQSDAAVASAFGRLANTMLSSDPRTLEDLVGEMLRPMLKEWLDDNLPVLVEKLVREEIERVSRGRR